MRTVLLHCDNSDILCSGSTGDSFSREYNALPPSDIIDPVSIVIWLSIATTPNHHKLRGLKQPIFFLFDSSVGERSELASAVSSFWVIGG